MSTALPPAAFTGLVAYPLTPLTHPALPDLDLLGKIVDRAVHHGVDGVAVLASSGSGTSFSAAERRAVILSAVEAAAGRVPVYVAVAASTTDGATRNARQAEQAGADGILLTPFSYIPLVDAEVVALTETVASASDLPLCFYNRPLQSGYDVTAEVLAHLAATTTLTAVKDPAALPDRPGGRVAELRTAGIQVGLSGDVALLSPAEPADAWHSGIAALLPREYVAIRAARVTETAGPEAEASRRWLLDIARTLATLRPVSGLHALAGLLGMPTAPPRGPMLPVPAEGLQALRAVVERRPALP